MTIRLYIPSPLFKDQRCSFSPPQIHFLTHVMRCQAGDKIHVFNAEEGEWRVTLAHVGKKEYEGVLEQQVRAPILNTPTITAFLSVLKPKRQEWAIEKLVELGVTDIQLLITERSQIRAPNMTRYQAIATEAAEQCNSLYVPHLHPIQSLTTWVKNLQPHEVILWGDERQHIASTQPLGTIDPEIFQKKKQDTSPPKKQKGLGFLVGPEGGFTTQEFSLLAEHPQIKSVSLGAHILRAETAALVFATYFMIQLDSERV